MSITIRFFAILRERAGREQLSMDLTDGMTVADALTRLADDGVLPADLPTGSFLCAINHDYVTRATALRPGDELALIPPVSGG